MTLLLRRTCSLLICLAFVLNTGCAPAAQDGSSQEVTPTPIPTSPVTAKPVYQVQRGEVIEQIQFNGRIVPVVQEAHFFRTDGRVRSVYVREGDRVKAGDVLADLENIDHLQRQVAFQKFIQERAQIGVEMAQLNLDLFKLNNHAASQGYAELLALKEKELRLAQISLEETNLTVSELEDTSEDAQVIAAIDGLIASVSLAEGRQVQAYDPVIVVVDGSALEASANLDNNEMEKLAEGMPALVVFSSRPGEEVKGEIRRLPPPYGKAGGIGVESDDRSTRISLPEGSVLRTGDSVRVTVLIEKQSDTLWLPPQAVRAFEGRRFVVVLDGSVQRRVDIKTGLQGNDRVEILDGLGEGQSVVAP